MNMNDFEQIKKNLKEEYNENCRKIDELDKKIRTISSKTRKEKIEESTRYEIEKKKLESFNKILEQSYDDLSAKENMINYLSDSYNIAEKDIDNRTSEKITNDIKKINDVLVKKQHEIDIMATKCVLKEKFWIVIDKFNVFLDTFIFGMVGTMLFMMLYDMPILYIKLLENMPIEISTFGIYVPTIIGGLVCGGYVLKRQKDYATAFNNIKKELENDAIPNFRDDEEDKQYDKELENNIKDTYKIKLKLEIEKQKLNNISQNSKAESCNNSCKEELDRDNLTCEKEPIIGKKLDYDTKFIDEQLEKYENSLNSSILTQTQGSKLVKKRIPRNDKK